MDCRGLGLGIGKVEEVGKLSFVVARETLFGMVDEALTGKSMTRSLKTLILIT
jgi:hypothetical protein